MGQGALPPVCPPPTAQGTPSPVNPLAYGTGDSVPRKPPSLRHKDMKNENFMGGCCAPRIRHVCFTLLTHALQFLAHSSMLSGR